MEYDIKEIKTNEHILCISTTPDLILFGGKSRRLKGYSGTSTVLCEHQKSIRFIDSKGNFFGCASYDCTATIFKDGTFFDKVEGPETEIKSLCFSDDTKFLALSTRGKTVWVCRICEEIEIDSIIEDHLHDVKGVKFNKSDLYSFSYDCTIKMYERFDLDESWELAQTIEEGSTVWNIEFYKDFMVSCNADGRIRVYQFRTEWCLLRSIEASIFPIHDIAIYEDTLCYVLNRDSIAILSMDLKLISVIPNTTEVNCLHTCLHRKALLCGLRDGTIKIIKAK